MKKLILFSALVICCSTVQPIDYLSRQDRISANLILGFSLRLLPKNIIHMHEEMLLWLGFNLLCTKFDTPGTDLLAYTTGSILGDITSRIIEYVVHKKCGDTITQNNPPTDLPADPSEPAS